MFENNTKEKIIDIVYEKLCDSFDTYFITSVEFVEQFEFIKNKIVEQILFFSTEYDRFLVSKNKEEKVQLLSINKETYIQSKFNSNWQTKHIALHKLKIEYSEDYEKFAKDFEDLFEASEQIFKDKDSFIAMKIYGKFSKNETTKENHLLKEFLTFLRKSYYNFGEFDFEEKCVKFQKLYLNSTNVKLYDLTKMNLAYIEFSGFEQVVVNVGSRNVTTGHSGWATNTFEVINNKSKYNFSTSAKDEKLIGGQFIHIFILQSQKKRLVKLSINLLETDQTTFLIYRDFEKISLKNDCEILITKHHGNEYLIFDNRKEALNFQEKIMEMKTGNNQYQRR